VPPGPAGTQVIAAPGPEPTATGPRGARRALMWRLCIRTGCSRPADRPRRGAGQAGPPSQETRTAAARARARAFAAAAATPAADASNNAGPLASAACSAVAGAPARRHSAGRARPVMAAAGAATRAGDAPAAAPELEPAPPLPLLELDAGIVTRHVLPHLRPAHRAALSLTCRKLRAAVAAGVERLRLPGGRCCPATAFDLAAAFPGVQELAFTPSNLHEAMNVLPTLLMTVRGAGRRGGEQRCGGRPGVAVRSAGGAPGPAAARAGVPACCVGALPQPRHHACEADAAPPPPGHPACPSDGARAAGAVAAVAARRPARRAERAPQVRPLLRVAQHLRSGVRHIHRARRARRAAARV
jgi:hypothetical protein